MKTAAEAKKTVIKPKRVSGRKKTKSTDEEELPAVKEANEKARAARRDSSKK